MSCGKAEMMGVVLWQRIKRRRLPMGDQFGPARIEKRLHVTDLADGRVVLV